MYFLLGNQLHFLNPGKSKEQIFLNNKNINKKQFFISNAYNQCYVLILFSREDVEPNNKMSTSPLLGGFRI